MTAEEQKAQKAQKAKTDKEFFKRMMDHHTKQVEHYAQKARECDVDVLELVSAERPGNFAGL